MPGVGVEVECEAATIEGWFHCDDPVTNAETYRVLVDGLAVVKAEHRAALWAHDFARADRVLAEVRDLTALCAAAAEGLDLQRRRFLATGHVWPLIRCSEF